MSAPHPLRRIRNVGAAAVLLLAATAAGATVSFPVEFDDAAVYLGLHAGSLDGVVAGDPAAAPGAAGATRGVLVDRRGRSVGVFTVIRADESDSIARVDSMAPGVTPAATCTPRAVNG